MASHDLGCYNSLKIKFKSPIVFMQRRGKIVNVNDLTHCFVQSNENSANDIFHRKGNHYIFCLTDLIECLGKANLVATLLGPTKNIHFCKSGLGFHSPSTAWSLWTWTKREFKHWIELLLKNVAPFFGHLGSSVRSSWVHPSVSRWLPCLCQVSMI